MSMYLTFNSALLIVAALMLRFITPPADRVRTIRAAVFVTVLAFPWDFFAIHTRAWTYPIAHRTVLGVPLNDLFFIFVASVITASALSRFVMTAPATEERSRFLPRLGELLRDVPRPVVLFEALRGGAHHDGNAQYRRPSRERKVAEGGGEDALAGRGTTL